MLLPWLLPVKQEPPQPNRHRLLALVIARVWLTDHPVSHQDGTTLRPFWTNR